MREVGDGTSVSGLGIGSGVIPRNAYLISTISTIATSGIAGYGTPVRSIRSIAIVRSSPVTVSVEPPTSFEGAMSWRVTRPSISTVETPFTVATRITRMPGSKKPPGMRFCSRFDPFATAKASWKPLRAPDATVTWALVSASTTSTGTGLATTGPIWSDRWTPLSTRASRNPFRQRDPQAPARPLGQLLRLERPVRVADAPVELGVAERLGRDPVEAVAGRHHVHAHVCQRLRLRHEAPAQVGDLPARPEHEPRHLGGRVPARGRERVRAAWSLEEQVVRHGIPLTPSAPRVPAGAEAARRSFCCWWTRKRLVPLCVKGRSLTLRTCRPRVTLARIGFKFGSKASSVIVNSVSRTGRMRCALQTKSVSGASSGAISSVPAPASAWFACSVALAG